MKYDWDKLIFTFAVALIGGYAVYAKDAATAGVCLGIMGAILRPGEKQPTNDQTTVTVSTPPKTPAVNLDEPGADTEISK